jgi:hypothetical protein
MEEVAGAQRQRETRGKRQVGCQRSPKIAQVNQQFGPLFHHVFDAVLRHGRPSAQNHGATMAKKKHSNSWYGASLGGQKTLKCNILRV